MKREPSYQFWVMQEAKPKQYKRALYKQPTGDGEFTWQVGHEYLSPVSERFENTVRKCAECADVMPFNYVRFLIEFFWPVKLDKKGRVVYPKQGRPDASNVQKSVEDALQKKRVPRALYSRRTQALDKLAESEYNPTIKRNHWEAVLTRAELEIETIKKTAHIGAAVLNDRETHDIRTILRWVEPDGPKCVRVSIWEALPGEYHTPRLQDWLKERDNG